MNLLFITSVPNRGLNMEIKIPRKLKTTELKRWYKEELEKRDRTIEKLKEENKILLKTAIRAAREANKDENNK